VSLQAYADLPCASLFVAALSNLVETKLPPVFEKQDGHEDEETSRVDHEVLRFNPHLLVLLVQRWRLFKLETHLVQLGTVEYVCSSELHDAFVVEQWDSLELNSDHA
jgi:hypothetical protein